MHWRIGQNKMLNLWNREDKADHLAMMRANVRPFATLIAQEKGRVCRADGVPARLEAARRAAMGV
jgi:hypothetical protein